MNIYEEEDKLKIKYGNKINIKLRENTNKI